MLVGIAGISVVKEKVIFISWQNPLIPLGAQNLPGSVTDPCNVPVFQSCMNLCLVDSCINLQAVPTARQTPQGPTKGQRVELRGTRPHQRPWRSSLRSSLMVMTTTMQKRGVHSVSFWASHQREPIRPLPFMHPVIATWSATVPPILHTSDHTAHVLGWFFPLFSAAGTW